MRISITFDKYISKNLFFAALGSNPSTLLAEATPPKKYASPDLFRGQQKMKKRRGY